jgi:pyruvate dehydrogenase E2 component (dihydrolipoamide acetyltransferase)
MEYLSDRFEDHSLLFFDKEELVACFPAHQSGTIEYSGRRKAIGKHMEESNHVPAVTEFATADATALIELRNHLKDKADELGVKLTYLAFFSKAVCAALRKFPSLNSHFTEESIQLFDDVHLGIAVDTEQGLVVPVIQNADKKSALEIASDIESLASQARENSLSAQQMQGSTFSISSIGKTRVEFFTPMINTPEAAILGIGGFREEPWVTEDDVDIRTVVPLSVSYDHRVVDGAQAAKFLTYLVELIEDPELLVLGGI